MSSNRKLAAAPKQFSLDRRGTIQLALAFAGTQFLFAKQLAAATRIFVNITSSTYGGVGNGTTDNTAAFNAAFTAIGAAGGGALYIPPGTYLITGSISYTGNGPITIYGDGQNVSIISIAPSMGIATAVNIAPSGPYSPVTIRELSFQPNSGITTLTNCTALAVSYSSPDLFNHLTIDNCDFNPTNELGFQTALALTNVNASTIRDVLYHANSSVTFATLSSCIDVRFNNLDVSNSAGIGIQADSYSQGLYISNSVFNGCANAVNTVSGGGAGLLGLFIDGSVMQSSGGPCLNLNQTTSGYITNTAFDSPNYNNVINLSNCNEIQINGCSINGAFNTLSGANGVNIGGTGNSVNNCSFTNLSVGVALESGATANTGRGIRMFQLGASVLIGAPVVQSGTTCYAIVDLSGNITNFFEWLGPNDTSLYTTKRNYYSQP